ncbi:hypothetical protein N7457_004948, partial [Penicillium paradoxum]|uniref:uncharacterized protein n=1 Tax=Penicillium paradoxum TaxID=176176 RepID=UPI00254755B8
RASVVYFIKIVLSELVRALRSSSGRAQFYSVSKKRQGLSTKTEREGQEVAEEIKYIGPTVANHQFTGGGDYWMNSFGRS